MEELSLHILDLVQNCIEAGASRVEITIEEDQENNAMIISVRDNGRGMSEDLVKRVVDPFYTTRTTRKVGLGIPLLKVAAEQTGGSFLIDSEVGRGTLIQASFVHDHIDRAPLGNMADTLVAILSSHDTLDIVYCHAANGSSFCLDAAELREICGDDLGHPKIIQWLREYIAEHENSLEG